MKTIHPHYVTDEQGKRVAVQLPINEWEYVQTMLRQLAPTEIQSRSKLLVKAEESWQGMITEGSIYAVRWEKDEDFPEGEACVVGDNGELITLFFKHVLE